MRAQREGQAAHVEEEGDECRVHEEVGDEHHEDVGRVGFLQSGELKRFSSVHAASQKGEKHLGKTIKPHDKGTSSEKSPLDALHVLEIPLDLPLATLVLILLLIRSRPREEGGIVPGAPLAPGQRLELQGRTLESGEGREGGAERLGRGRRGEGKAPSRAVERGLRLYGPALVLAGDLVAVDAFGEEGSLSASGDGVPELDCARERKGGGDFDDELLEPELDGSGGRVVGGERGRDGGPEAGGGGVGDCGVPRR